MSADVDGFVAKLGLPPFAHRRKQELVEYGEALGLERLKRQVALGERLYRCCWEPKDGPHHPLCPIGKKEGS